MKSVVSMKVGAGAAGGNRAGPTREERHVHAGIGRFGFAAGDGAAGELGLHRDAGAVVSEENDQRVFAETEGVELREKFADLFVHVGDHLAEVADVAVDSLALGLPAPVGTVGSGLIGVVGEHERAVEEERHVLFSSDEIERIVLAEVRAVFALG